MHLRWIRLQVQFLVYNPRSQHLKLLTSIIMVPWHETKTLEKRKTINGQPNIFSVPAMIFNLCTFNFTVPLTWPTSPLEPVPCRDCKSINSIHHSQKKYTIIQAHIYIHTCIQPYKTANVLTFKYKSTIDNLAFIHLYTFIICNEFRMSALWHDGRQFNNRPFSTGGWHQEGMRTKMDPCSNIPMDRQLSYLELTDQDISCK